LDYSNIGYFVFFDRRAERRFLGFASLTSIRHALTASSPLLETIYRGIHGEVSAGASTLSGRVEQLVYRWTAADFSSDANKRVDEKQFRQLVSNDLLHGWLVGVGRTLIRDAVAWSGETTPSLVRSIALEYRHEYVALLRGEGLDRVVNRTDLAQRIAARTLG
jgi:hypothetical protein